jgi:hypothetical protein
MSVSPPLSFASVAAGTPNPMASSPAGPSLYRDALTSVLSFLPLRGLAAALAVNKDWSTAVQTMRPAMFKVDISSARLNGLLSSRLQ